MDIRKTAIDLGQTNLIQSEWHQRQVSCLLRSEDAMRWLEAANQNPTGVVKRYGLGLTPPSKGRDYHNALVFPRVNEEGLFVYHYLHYNVPGVTSWVPGTLPRDRWGTKPVGLYYSGAIQGKTTLIIVSEPKAVWGAAALLQEDAELHEKVLIIAGTHGVEHFSKAPEARDAGFWSAWDRVIVWMDCSDERDLFLSSCLPLVPREVRLASTPDCFALAPGRGANWNGFVKTGDVATFRTILDAARPHTPSIFLGSKVPEDFEEVDAQSLFHRGHYYYAFEQLVKGVKDGNKAEEFQPFVVKSDGSILTVAKSPRLSSRGRDVLRLSDGTLIARYPRALRAGEASWEARSIVEFAKAKRDGHTLPLPRFGEMVAMARRHLKASVWLPYEEDYVVITLGILASYAQEIFSAVPLFLLVGPAGSGKTALADESAKLGCNGRALGRMTLAGFMEATDRCRGLIALDDLEEVAPGKSGRNTVSTNQYQQIIKQSYKKTSGTQTRMGDRGELKIRNLYGIKILNNTKGVDEITATRLFAVQTRRRTEAKKIEMEPLSSDVLSPDQIRVLRNRLHQWVFSNVQSIASTYEGILGRGVERSDEIAAPLRTLAKLSEDNSVHDQLEAAIARRDGKQVVDEEQAFEDAITAIVAQGQRHICAQHVANEMKQQLGPDWGKAVEGDIPEWQQPKSITRKLIAEGWVDPKPCRPRIKHEVQIRMRTYPLRPDRLKDILETLSKQGRSVEGSAGAPGSFCAGCSKCDYRSFCGFLKGGNAAELSR